MIIGESNGHMVVDTGAVIGAGGRPVCPGLNVVINLVLFESVLTTVITVATVTVLVMLVHRHVYPSSADIFVDML